MALRTRTDTCRQTSLVVGLLVLASPLARAQEFDLTDPEGPELVDPEEPQQQVAPEAVVVEAPDWSESHLWLDLDFPGPAMALARTGSGALLAMDRSGFIYRRSGSGRWRRTLGINPSLAEGDELDEEGMLLDVEASVEDFLGSEQDESTTEPQEVGADPVELDLSTGAIDDAVRVGIQDAEDRVGGSSGAAGPSFLWTDPEDPSLVIAGSGAKTWRSVDGGLSWGVVDTLEGASEVVRLRPGEAHLIASTRAGVRHSLDAGRSWLAVDDALGELEVSSVAAVGGEVFAGTEAGLFVSSDGLRWTRLAPEELAQQRITAVAGDPWWDDGMWVAAEGGLYRTDDLGRTFRWAGRNPLAGTKGIAVLDRTGHLLASGDDGVWESADGGLRWAPLYRGLPGPVVHELVVSPEQEVWIAGEGGVYRLGRPDELKEATVEEEAAASQAGVPEVGVVMDMALRRTGIDYEPLTVQRAIASSIFMPTLRITGRLDLDRRLATDFSSIETDLLKDRSWYVGTELCFGMCGSSGTDFAAVSTEDLVNSGNFAVVDGQIYETEGAGNYAPAGANVAERISRYRAGIAGTVAELYFSRIQLDNQRRAHSGLSLREQVETELELAEVTARLDIFTDGNFSSALSSP